MATTTNYGWTTPDDTDLVKDGAAAIRTLGSSVDTTTKALNPETTTGDIAYRSATANTNTRLALGTAGQVLTVNSGATAPEWATAAAAGMTVLASGSLGSAGISLSSISGSYKDLQLVIRDFAVSTSGGPFVRVNSDSGSNYSTIGTLWSGSAASVVGENFTLMGVAWASISTGDNDNACVVNFLDYANTSSHKLMTSQLKSQNAAGTSITQLTTAWKNTAAIDAVNFTAGVNFSGGTYILYGVN
jgi:hypothetical protein